MTVRTGVRIGVRMTVCQYVIILKTDISGLIEPPGQKPGEILAPRRNPKVPQSSYSGGPDV
jgi:hypothetical protein